MPRQGGRGGGHNPYEPARCAAGIATTELWRQLPAGRFAETLAIAALVALPAWGLRRWRRWPWAGALALAWTAMLAAMGGVPEDIVDRQLAHFDKVHPDYGAGVRKARQALKGR